jgi:hypothetical protein
MSQADRIASTPFDDEVAEVAGDPFTALQTAAALSIGVLCLVGAGVLSLLLSALVDEHRLTAAGIGQAAMLEALSMGLSTALAGIVLKPRHLPLIGIVASAALVALNLATLPASGASVLAVRALAGVPEGVLLWIAVGLISRTVNPARWAAVLFTGMGVTQLIAAAALSAWGLPRFGANSGYVALAVTSAACAALALFLPRDYGVVPGAEGAATGAPPLRGWVALLGTLGFSGSVAAVSVYLVPLAHDAGLSTNVGRTAVSVSLGFQILGGVLATLLAGRIGYLLVFWVCAMTSALVWGSYALDVPAWWFVAVSGAGGLATMLGGPFLTPMTIDADPTRRAVVQSGAAQVLAGAVGPFLASLFVTDTNARGALALAAPLLALGLAVITGVYISVRRTPTRSR